MFKDWYYKLRYGKPWFDVRKEWTVEWEDRGTKLSPEIILYHIRIYDGDVIRIEWEEEGYCKLFEMGKQKRVQLLAQIYEFLRKKKNVQSEYMGN